MRKHIEVFVAWTVYGVLLLGSLTASSAGLFGLGILLAFLALIAVLYLTAISAI